MGAELDPGEPVESAAEQTGLIYRIGQGLGALLFLVLIVGCSYAIYDAVTADRPVPTNPDFLNVIVASDSVVAAIRIVIIAAAVFVVLSVGVLISRQQWLVGFGPVRVAESVSDLNAEYQNAVQLLHEAYLRIDALEEQLEATTNVLDGILLEDDPLDPGGIISDPEEEDQGK